jgi:hypothetical protein
VLKDHITAKRIDLKKRKKKDTTFSYVKIERKKKLMISNK